MCQWCCSLLKSRHQPCSLYLWRRAAATGRPLSCGFPWASKWWLSSIARWSKGSGAMRNSWASFWTSWTCKLADRYLLSSDFLLELAFPSLTCDWRDEPGREWNTSYRSHSLRQSRLCNAWARVRCITSCRTRSHRSPPFGSKSERLLPNEKLTTFLP